MTGNADVIDNKLSGEWLQSRPGERFLIRIPASATNGSYSVTEILSSHGDSTPVHLHENEDEAHTRSGRSGAGPVRGQDIRRHGRNDS
ncbi:MAG: Cupin 2 conserved barrel domain protein [Bryobacterales bacterium]|nr:Cupin 2 conserved barrel domain protein [Bryobacterales bacterium]